jgi:ABC-type glycerol-3-phosphate transport system permease component
MFFDLNNHTLITKYKWRFKNYPYIKITSDKKIINTKTGRVLKYTVNGYSKGIWINKKFLTNINNHIEKI